MAQHKHECECDGMMRKRRRWRQVNRDTHTTKENRVWIEINKCHPYWNDISNLYQHFAFILQNTFTHLNSYAHQHVQSDAAGMREGIQSAYCLVFISSLYAYVLFVAAAAVAVVVCFIHLNFNRKLENRIYIFIFKWVNLSRIKTLAISLLYVEWVRDRDGDEDRFDMDTAAYWNIVAIEFKFACFPPRHQQLHQHRHQHRYMMMMLTLILSAQKSISVHSSHHQLPEFSNIFKFS